MSPPESGRLRWCFTFAPAGQEDPPRGKGPAPEGQEGRAVKPQGQEGRAVKF